MIEDTISSCREVLIRVRMERRRLVTPAPRRGTHVFTLQEIGDEIIDHRGELKGQAIWPLDQGYGVHIME